jgi:hypothetical protein
MAGKETSTKTLQIIAMVATWLGALLALYFMYSTAHNQKSMLLIALFTVWVLSPFAGIFMATKAPERWIRPVRTPLYWTMIILAIGAVMVYSGTIKVPHTKPAFIFLVAPFVSWLLIIAVFLIAKSRKSNHHLSSAIK